MPTPAPRDKAGLLGVVAVALAVACCAGAPLLVAAIGELGLLVWVGVGAGGAALLLAIAIVALYVRGRRSPGSRALP